MTLQLRRQTTHALTWTVALLVAAMTSVASAQSGGLPKELTDGGLLPLDGTGPATPATSDSATDDEDPALQDGPTSVTAELVGRIPDDAIEKDPEKIARLWRLHYRLYAMRFTKIDDEYVSCATYDRRYPSSRGVTTSQLIAQATQERRVSGGGISRVVKIEPDKDDAELAAESIMDLEPGQYGTILSAKVDAVLGPQKMVVSDIWLVDTKEIAAQKKADLAKVPDIRKPTFQRPDTRRYSRNDGRNRADYDRYERDRERRIEAQYEANVRAREDLIKRIEASYIAREKLADIQGKNDFGGQVLVEGFSTGRVKPGQRWDGDRPGQRPQIAVVGYEASSDERSSRSRRGKRLRAVPAYLFRRSLNESQFLDMLSRRDVSVGEFVNEVIKATRRDRDSSTSGLEAQPRVFDFLESRRSQSAAAKQAKAD